MKQNQRIFNRFAENLKSTMADNNLALTKDGQKIDQMYYLCPISLMLFPQESLIAGRLTIEHVPPRSLGGKPLLLTSKAINSADGHSTDKTMLNFFQTENFKSGNGGILTIISSEELDLNGVGVMLSIGKVRGKLGIKMLTSTTNMEALDYKGLFKNWNGGKFKVRGNLQNSIEQKTLLKCAYLTAFASIGYPLIMSKEGLREQTFGPLIDFLNGVSLEKSFPCVFFNHHAPIENSHLGIVTWEGGNRCFVVNLNFKLNDVNFQYAVFLPHPDSKDLKCIEELALWQLEQRNTIIDFKVTPIHGRL
ncbi:MAG: hypothetical protein EOO46_07865 [Flavobacterium sp.]|nr:MAG: hypothetical protein EOO46_07865 [Flavobacterium sp.]